ncbi:hypothetical protein HFX_6122 (plasmid) [Haloferax mediterranei ATCC 33500]|nr:hypothetical protein HFX_6122 [Haloferax mediterranei ATCC 33500]
MEYIVNMVEFFKLAYKALSEVKCTNCNSRITGTPKFEPSNQEGFKTQIKCSDCGGRNWIFIKDIESHLILSIANREIDEPFDGDEYISRKTIYKQDLEENLVERSDSELLTAFDVLKLNYQRRDSVFDQISLEMVFHPDSQAFVYTEIHNYVSSAYTFDEILNNTVEKLGIEEEVEFLSDDKYDTHRKPILGLRHYVQHNQLMPISINMHPIIEGKSGSEPPISIKKKTIFEDWTLVSQKILKTDTIVVLIGIIQKLGEEKST